MPLRNTLFSNRDFSGQSERCFLLASGEIPKIFQLELTSLNVGGLCWRWFIDWLLSQPHVTRSVRHAFATVRTNDADVIALINADSFEPKNENFIPVIYRFPWKFVLKKSNFENFKSIYRKFRYYENFDSPKNSIEQFFRCFSKNVLSRKVE